MDHCVLKYSESAYSLDILFCVPFLCFSYFQAVCGEVEQSERVKEKIQEDVNKLKQQIALRKRKTAEEERSMYFLKKKIL